MIIDRFSARHKTVSAACPVLGVARRKPETGCSRGSGDPQVATTLFVAGFQVQRDRKVLGQPQGGDVAAAVPVAGSRSNSPTNAAHRAAASGTPPRKLPRKGSPKVFEVARCPRRARSVERMIRLLGARSSNHCSHRASSPGSGKHRDLPAIVQNHRTAEQARRGRKWHGTLLGFASPVWMVRG